MVDEQALRELNVDPARIASPVQLQCIWALASSQEFALILWKKLPSFIDHRAFGPLQCLAAPAARRFYLQRQWSSADF